ncbi:MAG: hypothetical protein ABMB14_30040 [Myxococcota bacterium]
MTDPLKEIAEDLQRAPANRVVYLEGNTDDQALFALLGVSAPPDSVVDGVLIRGLRPNRGSGGSAVRHRVESASARGFRHVYGVLDGDGADPTDPFPGPGPLFVWPGYAIENLVVRAGWPPAFGDPPDWPTVMRAHAGAVALNRVVREVQERLGRHGLRKFLRPSDDPTAVDRKTVRAALVGADAIGRDLVARFDRDADAFEARVDQDLAAAHAWIDGKWLVEHHVGRVMGVRDVRTQWLAHLASTGGLPEVRAWWDARIRPG